MNLTIWQQRECGELKGLKNLLKKDAFLNLFLNVVKARLKQDFLKEFSFKECFFTKELFHYSSLKDFKKAAQRINKALKEKEKIAIFADYDCDGICSAALLFKFFKKFKANVLVSIV